MSSTSSHTRNRSWLEGTMDVIANVAGNESRTVRTTARSPSPAPRPNRRALAPPDSPQAIRSARSFSPAPAVTRVPSKDAMDRSIHNESTHGKSTAQTIRDLKAANASLTSKTADMEADFMNQCNVLSNQIRTLTKEVRKKDQQISQYESRAATAEKRIKEADKVREEAEFSKHTIADLKSQLYQLQHEIEESEYDRQDETDRIRDEAAESERVYREKIADLTKEVEKLRAESAGTTVGEDGHAGRHVADSDIQAYEDEISMLKKKLSEAEAEAELVSKAGSGDEQQQQLEAVRREKEREVGELRSMLRARDDAISSLQVKVSEYTEEMTSLESELDRYRSAVADEEEGRQESEKERHKQVAELRETVEEQQKTLKEKTRELEEQLDANAAMTKEISELKRTVKALESDAFESGGAGAAAEERAARLQEELRTAEATMVSLKRESADGDEAHRNRIAQLEQDLDEAESELETVRGELAKVRDKASARGEEESETVSVLRKEVEDVTRERTRLEGELTKKLASVKSANLQTVTKLEICLQEKEEEVERLKAKLEGGDAVSTARALGGTYEVDRLNEELEKVKAELGRERKELNSKIDGYVKDKAVLEAEIAVLKKDLKSMEKLKGSSSDVKDLKKQLRQAQVALVALDNEKLKEKKKFTESFKEAKSGLAAAEKNLADEKAMHKEAMESFEAEKEQMRTETEKQIGEKDETIKDLQAAVCVQEQRVADLVSEVDSLRVRLEKTAESSQTQAQTSDELVKTKRVLKERENEVETAKNAIGALESTLRERQNDLELAQKQAASLEASLAERERKLETTKSATRALETTLSERQNELELAQKRADDLEATLKERENKGVVARSAVASTDFPEDEAGTLMDRVKALEAEKSAVECELKAKLEDRDTTISSLAKSSARAEQNLNTLKAEIAVLQEKLKHGGGDNDEELQRLKNMEAVKAARNAELKDELESMREALDQYKRVEDQLSKEVSMLEHDLSVAKAEVQRLKSTSSHSSGDEELLKQIAGLQEERQMMEEDHREKVLERDAAISKLVKSSLSQEEQISSLQEEMEKLRRKKNGSSSGSTSNRNDGPTWEELHRLQQESEIFAGQIIEQDEEMEGLRVELEEQKAKNTKLIKDMSDLKKKLRVGGGDSSKIADLQAHLDEVREANEEYRMELKDLRKKLRHAHAEADRVEDLELQLREAQSSLSDIKARSVNSFQGDEMVEEDLREQLENALASKAAVEAELRKQRRSVMGVGEKSSKVEEELRQDLEEAIASKDAVEERLTKQIESLRKLKDSAKHDFEVQLRERDDEIAVLKKEASQHEEFLASLRKDVEELRTSLDEKSQLAKTLEKDADELRSSLDEQIELTKKERSNATAEFDDEMKSVSLNNESLAKKVEELESELQSLENGSSDIKDLRKRLKVAEEDRTKVEQKISLTYERKITLMQTEKDMEVDGLRKELTASKEKLSNLEQERASLMNKLESSNVEIQEELEERLHRKNAKIMALEQTLAAQEQVLGNMQAEMDQLQSGMDKVSLTRRAEIEEMEQELMESAQNATKYEREIAVLKDRLEDYKLRHTTEVAKLKERIEQLQKESPMERSVREQRDDHKVQELNEKIDHLKWRLSGLQEDNQKLREKLEKQQNAVHHKRNSSTDKWRNAALQEQVALLSQKNKDLEKHIGSTGSFGHSSLSTIETRKTARTSPADSSSPLIFQSASFDMPPSPAKSTSAANGTRSSSTGRAMREPGQSARGESLTPSKFERPRNAASPSRIRASLGIGATSPRYKAPFHRRKGSSGGGNKSLRDHLRGGGKKSEKGTDDQISTHTEMTF